MILGAPLWGLEGGAFSFEFIKGTQTTCSRHRLCVAVKTKESAAPGPPVLEVVRTLNATVKIVETPVGWPRGCSEQRLKRIKQPMKSKKIEPEAVACTRSAIRPFGCMELWAGNERAHRSIELAGLEADVIAVPSGGDTGGDLSAVFSCSDNVGRVVLADCVGHGYVASGVARHVHRLLHKHQDIRDTASLLAALNDEFTLDPQIPEETLRLTTVVTGTFDGVTGEFNFAYAAHPRMLLWREREHRFLEIGEGLENFPLGFVTGESYNEQSVRLQPGDMILAFSDGATEVRSPADEQLTPRGFLQLAETTLGKLARPLQLPDFSAALLEGVHLHRGGSELEDDITLLTLRRSG
jgi:hypothetical protein